MQYNFLCQINCFDVLLEDVDIVKAITEYVSFAAIEDLVLGAPSRHGFIRYVPYHNFDFYICVCVYNMTAAYVHGFRRKGNFAWPMKHYLYAV